MKKLGFLIFLLAACSSETKKEQPMKVHYSCLSLMLFGEGTLSPYRWSDLQMGVILENGNTLVLPRDSCVFEVETR